MLEGMTVEGGRAGRLLAARRRGRRTRRPARRRAGERSAAPLFGLLPDHRRPGGARRRAARRRVARAGDGSAASTSSAPTGPASRSCPTSASGRTCSSIRWPRGCGLFSYLAPRREKRGVARARRGRSGCGRTIRACRSSSSPAATSRRSSSGRWLHLAQQGLHLRGPDRRRRRRREGGDLPAVRRRAAGGRGDHHRLDRLRGGRQGLPPRAGLRPRPGRRRARRRRPVGGEPARRGLGPRRTDGGLHGSRETGGDAMQSIKSNALEPTRSELAGLVALAGRSCAWLRSTVCRS